MVGLIFWAVVKKNSVETLVCQKEGFETDGSNGNVQNPGMTFHYPYDPWDWYIYLHWSHKNQQNVGEYGIHGSYGLYWLDNWDFYNGLL